MKTRQKTGPSISGVIFTVVIAILSLILLSECFYIYNELKEEDYRYHVEESDYLRYVNYEEYYRIYDQASYDCVPTRTLTKTETEIRALGYYYEAASLYKAYLAIDDADAAAGQLARMERYRAEAGAYASETTKIDERLGI